MEEDIESSETIFDSLNLNLNPQLFLNEVLNHIDDLVNDGFESFEQRALERFGVTSKEEESELRKGFSSIHNIIQDSLAKRLGMWEKYCLKHCFTVPDGLSLPKADTLGDSLMDNDALIDAELDNQLDSLREKLSVAGKESDKLQREFHAMKKQSITNSCVESVNEALAQFEESSVQDMFQEMVKKAAELRAKMEEWKNKRMAEMEHIRTKKIYNLDKDQTLVHHMNGLSDEDLCDLQKHVVNM